MSDKEMWMWLGREMDSRPTAFRGETFGMFLAREFLRVRDKRGELVPLAANAVQRRYEARRGRHNIVLKARQMGLSTWVSGRLLLKTILVPGTMTVQVAHTREAAEQIFYAVQRMYDNLPQEMREGVARRSRANVGQMVFAGVDSEFRVVSAADENAGRGMSITHLHCSEVSRWPGDASATLAGLKAALRPEGEMVLESTPNGAYGCFYEEWSEAEAQGMVRHFFPWWMEPSYMAAAVAEDSLHDDERALVEREGLSLEQIGFRRWMQATYRGMAVQEFAEDAVRCFRASGHCLFELDEVEDRMEKVAGPIESRRNGALLVWMPAVPGREYVIAVDPAGGGSDGDYAAVQVVDRATGLQCAELRERLHPRALTLLVASLAAEYNDALVVVERNNHGMAVLAYLEREDVRLYMAKDRQAGWLTSAVSRPEILSKLAVMLTERPAVFRSRRLLAECRTFVSTASGRAEAASGSHDDCVMAMAIAQAVR
jgi:hypothetical protein